MEVFVSAHSVFSPLGSTSFENYQAVKFNQQGVKTHDRKDIDDDPIVASLIDSEQEKIFSVFSNNELSRFEKLCIQCITDALKLSSITISGAETLLILSTTKGNVREFEKENYNHTTLARHSLWNSAKIISGYFNNPNTPVIISNACISGISAIIHGKRLIKSGCFKNAVIVGADEIGKFIYSGFNSFHALAKSTCKPFAADRDGINLGEAAACIILSNENGTVSVQDGFVSNDANHISGPSKTGHELGSAIIKTLKPGDIKQNEIAFISAHGTATPYNDEMEAKAIAYAGLSDVPVFSLKPYFGHTLGAAGILESIIGIMALEEGMIPVAHPYPAGVSADITINTKITSHSGNIFIKTGSGFGGCNAAIAFSKLN